MRPYTPDRQPRSIALRYRLGVAFMFLLAALLAVETAQADTGERAPLSMLVKFDDRDYEISYADTVSLEPISTATVQKIGYGHSRDVNIVTTSTGTYSTDGMISANVLYPGIDVRRVSEEVPHFPYAARPSGPGFSILSIGRSPLSGALVVNRVNDLGVRSCIMRSSIMTCYRTY